MLSPCNASCASVPTSSWLCWMWFWLGFNWFGVVVFVHNAETHFLVQPNSLMWVSSAQKAELFCVAEPAVHLTVECPINTGNEEEETDDLMSHKLPSLRYQQPIIVCENERISLNYTIHYEEVQAWFGDFLCRCVAWNNLLDIGETRPFMSDTANIKLAYITHTFVQEPQSQEVAVGGNVTFHCRPPDAKPGVQIAWFHRPSSTLMDQPLLTNGTNTEDLHFTFVNADQAGSYYCVVTNMAGQRISRLATLFLFEQHSWSSWSSWSPCPNYCTQGQMCLASCSSYLRRRQRLCESALLATPSTPVSPVVKQYTCHGLAQETQACDEHCLEVTGPALLYLSEWNYWQVCDESTCVQERRRECIDDLVANDALKQHAASITSFEQCGFMGEVEKQTRPCDFNNSACAHKMISSPQIIRDNVESVVVITVIVLLVILCLVMLAFCGWRMTACSFIKLKTSHHDVGHDASHQLIRAPYHPGVIPDPLYHAQYEVIDLCQISSPYDQVTLSRDPRHCVTLRVDCFGGKWHLPEWGLGLYIAPQASLSLGAEHTLLISVDSSFQLGQLKFHQTPKRSAVLSSMVHVHWLESSASSRPVTIAVPHWLPEQAMGNVKIDLVHMEESFKQQNATFAVGKESFFVLLYHPSTTFALVNHLNAAETPPSSRYRLVVYAHEVDCPAETSIIIFCYIIHDSDDVEYRLQLELNKQFMGDPPKFVQRHTNMVLLDDGQLMLCIGCQDIDAGWHCAMADIYQEVSMANILDDSKHHCLYKVTLVPDSETPPDHDFMFHIVLFQKHHFHQPTKIPCRPLPKLKMKKQFPRPELLWQSVPKSDVQIEVDIQEIEETLANVKSPHDWMMLTQILGFQYVSLPPLPLPNGDISSSAHSLYSLLQVKQTGLRSTISPHVPL